MLPRRLAETRVLPAPPAELDLYRDVSDRVRAQARAAGRASRLSLQTLQRIAGSSPAALAASLERAGWHELAGRARDIGSSEKARALLAMLPRSPEQGKVIVFTSFTATLDRLAEQVGAAGIDAAVYHGSLTRREKDAAIARFRHDVDVLLSSEAGGEGRNLQCCHTMINFDVPWNPMQIEQRLGCRACLPRAPVAEPEVIVVGRRVPPSPNAASAPPSPPPSPQSPRAQTRPPEAVRLRQRREKEQLKREAAQQRANRASAGARMANAGDLLAVQLWRACAMRRELPERSVLRHTPYAVLQRVFGAEAPQVALGLPRSAAPDGTMTRTSTEWSESGGAVTWGTVRAAGAAHRYLLRWRSGRGGPQAVELLPIGGLAAFLDPSLDTAAAGTAIPALFAAAPAPLAPLDAVEALLWEREVAGLGIPVVARCLAMWSSMRPLLEDHAPQVVAAALTAVATRQWRRPRTVAAVSRDYDASPQAVRRTMKDIRWLSDRER